jgi:valyl-tRNA synthetase
MAELPKTYDPNTVEPDWYARWLNGNAFRADATSGKPPFSIVIPPPNVTGMLTLGHVLNNTIQDILSRRARMRGCEVLWLPGMDHAGLATQTAFEKWLRKNENVTRQDLGRDEFIRRVWKWKEKHGGIIIEQLKRLGCSCDWSRERFTLDQEYSRAVQRVFVELYTRGLIYKGRRMINWDPVALTALSDEEVIPTPMQNTLFYVRYEFIDKTEEYLEVATTRPETIMADMALAVHPDDERYKNLIGQKVWRPLAREPILIIADRAIDPKFGTGVLKVTPAHDRVDFEIGARHKLPVIDVLTEDARINCPAEPELHGLDRFAARERAAKILHERGLLSKIEPHESNVGVSERAGVPIEPRLSEQWFLHYPKTEEALRVVREHLIRFFPAHWEKVYGQWLENIQDWCISRQVWWGHRIPAWYSVGQVSNLPGEQTQVEDSLHFRGLDEFADIEISQRRLPHWRQEGATYFVTFRLADAIPAEKQSQFREEKDRWLQMNPEPWNEQQKREYSESFSARFERWLDAGYGSCALADPVVAKIVADALKHFSGERYELGPWVVMPNHVHVLVTPRPNHNLREILHSWKRFTATEINRQRGSEGQLWQHESYDHIVRDHEALGRITEYIERNPEFAGISVAQVSSVSQVSRVAQVSNLREQDSQVENLRHENLRHLRVQIDSPGEGWIQDSDTLDTWFSSWLWAFETMDAETRAKFYPTSVLVTAADIIFFWVARMIIAGLEFKPGKSKRDEDNIPFRDVFFTGIIRDQQGRKMSKSLGNSPDPLALMAKYGADGLRFGLMRMAPSGQDIRFDEKQIEEGRNFATKLWNVARFRQMQSAAQVSNLRVEQNGKLETCPTDSIYSVEVLARLNETIATVEASYSEYQFNAVAQRLYDFVWGDFCDWFVEAAKTEIFGNDIARKTSVLAVMDHVLSAILRLLHPFMPHVTDELWERMGFPRDEKEFLDFVAVPAPTDLGDESRMQTARAHVRAIYETVEAGRNLRAEARIPSNRKARFALRSDALWIEQEHSTLARFLNAETLEIDRNFQTPANSSVAATRVGELFLLRDEADRAAERERLEKEISKLESDLKTTEAKLANSAFIERAPAAVVEEHRQRRDDLTKRLTQLRQARAPLD